MGLYIPDVSPSKNGKVLLIDPWGNVRLYWSKDVVAIGTGLYLCKASELPPHGRLGDLDALRRAMYHEAFETDSPMQKWDSGCWIRYKMFERMEEAAPTIIPAEGGDAE